MKLNRRDALKMLTAWSAASLLAGVSTAHADKGRGGRRRGHDDDDDHDEYRPRKRKPAPPEPRKQPGSPPRQDQDDVLKYRQSESILSFSEITEKVSPLIDGEIIEAKFEVDKGIPVYEFKYINRKGRVMELYVDARTGTLIKLEAD